MAEGHGRDEWCRLSVLMALMANVNRDPKKGRAFNPSDFDPYAKQGEGRIVVDENTIGDLKKAFSNVQGARR